MLSISKPMHGAGQGGYYLNLAREDYYLAGGEPPGLWYGEGAKLLNLSGIVEGETFGLLLRGFSPDGRCPLTQNAGRPDRQSGWDLTFSAPKSVSVLWALSERDVQRGIQKAHQQAVTVALKYLEDSAGLTRRGKGGPTLEKTPLVFAMFEHSTSRALDPDLHTHVVLINLAQRADASTGTLHTKEIFRQKMAAGSLYQVELASELQRSLGLRVEPRKTAFHVMGVSEPLCRVFSKRRRDIEARLLKTGRSGAIASKVAALDTRGAKISVSRAELFKTWAETGQAHGWGREEATNLSCLQKRERRDDAGDRELIRKEVLRSVFSRKDAGSTVVSTAKFAQTLGISASIVLDVLKHHIGQLGLTVRDKRLFPAAPSWSPFSKLRLPYLALKSRPIRKRAANILMQKRTPFGTVQIQQKLLFPNAPKWSPAHGLKAPVISMKPDPSSIGHRRHSV